MRNAVQSRRWPGARVRGLSDGVAGVFQRHAQDAPQALFVFDEKDVRHEARSSQTSEVRIIHARVNGSRITVLIVISMRNAEQSDAFHYDSGVSLLT